MFILEQRYGNDGYSFWFKLLESLGTEEGHFIDLRSQLKWEYLQAKTRLSGEVCCSMLDLLAKLEAIDKELWTDKIVWSQNFVDGLAPVYGNRRVDIPSRPSYLHVDIPAIGIHTGENPQSKGSKVKEVKNTYPLDFLTFYSAYPKKKKRDDAFKAWKSLNGKRPPIETIIEAIETQKNSPDWVKDNGQFIPYPASWLRAGSWADEVEQEQESSIDAWARKKQAEIDRDKNATT